jgi:hypothetical protein
MPKGVDIPALRLSTLTKLVETDMKVAPGYFQNQFPTSTYPSDTVEWESIVGNLGLTPFVAPGTVSPTLAPSGVGTHSAKAAFWKEKMYMDEEWLNNLRKPGARDVYETAERKLARELFKMKNRCMRRREWMCAKALINDGFSYQVTGGTVFTLDYGRPSEHEVQLAGNYRWENGTSDRINILGDVYDAKEAISNATDDEPTTMLFNSHTARLLVEDSGIQNLLKKSNFGNGDLFTRTGPVLSSLFGIPNVVIMDAKYKVYAYITAISGTTMYVDDVADIEVGMVGRFKNMRSGTYEDETVSAVDYLTGTVTFASAPSATFVAGRDRIEFTKKFVSDTDVLFYTPRVEGAPILEFMNVPFGLDRRYGLKVDRMEEWDPEGLWIRVQNKGLPIIYNRDATYLLKHD